MTAPDSLRNRGLCHHPSHLRSPPRHPRRRRRGQPPQCEDQCQGHDQETLPQDQPHRQQERRRLDELLAHTRPAVDDCQAQSGRTELQRRSKPKENRDGSRHEIHPVVNPADRRKDRRAQSDHQRRIDRAPDAIDVSGDPERDRRTQHCQRHRERRCPCAQCRKSTLQRTVAGARDRLPTQIHPVTEIPDHVRPEGPADGRVHHCRDGSRRGKSDRTPDRESPLLRDDEVDDEQRRRQFDRGRDTDQKPSRKPPAEPRMLTTGHVEQYEHHEHQVHLAERDVCTDDGRHRHGQDQCRHDERPLRDASGSEPRNRPHHRRDAQARPQQISRPHVEENSRPEEDRRERGVGERHALVDDQRADKIALVDVDPAANAWAA